MDPTAVLTRVRAWESATTPACDHELPEMPGSLGGQRKRPRAGFSGGVATWTAERRAATESEAFLAQVDEPGDAP